MASLQVFNPTLSPSARSEFNLGRKLSCSCWKSPSESSRKSFLKLSIFPNSTNFTRRGLRVRCKADDSDNQNNGEEPPESLFMKELKRRGIDPMLGEANEPSKLSSREIDELIYLTDSERKVLRRNEALADIQRSVSNQRERSMALNSEGLEGLIPRAKLLLTLGGTFFLAFAPLILVTVSLFTALYFYFGSTFVHDASKLSIAPPQYVDPYALLEDPRMS